MDGKASLLKEGCEVIPDDLIDVIPSSIVLEECGLEPEWRWLK